MTGEMAYGMTGEMAYGMAGEMAYGMAGEMACGDDVGGSMRGCRRWWNAGMVMEDKTSVIIKKDKTPE